MTREEIIVKYAKDKEVLDIGSVNETGEHELWRVLKSISKSLKGIDLRASNDPDVVQGDMESYDFHTRFDLIVAGDVLIQTDNQGILLDNFAKHLKTDGRLIVTLPNAKWPTVFLRPSRFQTGWHDRYTLVQLMNKHGFEAEKVYFYSGNKHNFNWLRKIFLRRQSLLVVGKLTVKVA